ncbi:MAG: hypothetical protein IT292_09445 [Deltaproteobacteria bacterium]|nr:hypothetical protein [Deltaproteobacteria bacterium]
MIRQEFKYDSGDYSFTWTTTGDSPFIDVQMDILQKQTGPHFIEKHKLLSHHIEDLILTAKDSSSSLQLIFATLEPLVKGSGSFISCFRKEC